MSNDFYIVVSIIITVVLTFTMITGLHADRIGKLESQVELLEDQVRRLEKK